MKNKTEQISISELKRNNELINELIKDFGKEIKNIPKEQLPLIALYFVKKIQNLQRRGFFFASIFQSKSSGQRLICIPQKHNEFQDGDEVLVLLKNNIFQDEKELEYAKELYIMSEVQAELEKKNKIILNNDFQFVSKKEHKKLIKELFGNKQE